METSEMMVKIKDWLERKITLRNINRYALPLTATIANFNLANSLSPAVSIPVITLNSLGVISSSWIHNYVENFKKNHENVFLKQQLWSFYMFVIFIGVFVEVNLLIKSSPNAQQSEQDQYNIKSITAAASIILPWLIYNASEKFFTLSEDLLDDDQLEILNTILQTNNTLSKDEQEQLKEELANFSDSSKKYLFAYMQQTITAVANTDNMPTDNTTPEVSIPNIVSNQDPLIFSDLSSSTNNHFAEPAAAEVDSLCRQTHSFHIG